MGLCGASCYFERLVLSSKSNFTAVGSMGMNLGVDLEYCLKQG